MRVLASFVILLLFTIPAFSHDWTKTAERVMKSVVQLTTDDGQAFCTGWVINNKLNFITTADHCVHAATDISEIFIDGLPVMTEVYGNEAVDVAVLEVPTVRPALQPRTKPIKIGLPILSFGSEFGEPLTVRSGLVSRLISEDGYEWVMFDESCVSGMSGGPVVDSDGKVVAMNTNIQSVLVARNAYVGLACFGHRIDQLLDETRQYWERE